MLDGVLSHGKALTELEQLAFSLKVAALLGQLRYAGKEEQQVADACKRLVQNALQVFRPSSCAGIA